jgi:transcriptional regulator with XRE-family HTH domain
MPTLSSQRTRPPLRHDPAALRQARKDAGFNQTQLAHLAGISQPYLSMLESGVHTPGERLLATLAAFCGVPADSLRV